MVVNWGTGGGREGGVRGWRGVVVEGGGVDWDLFVVFILCWKSICVFFYSIRENIS